MGNYFWQLVYIKGEKCDIFLSKNELFLKIFFPKENISIWREKL